MSPHQGQVYIQAAALMVQAIKEELSISEISPEKLMQICAAMEAMLELALTADVIDGGLAS